MKSKWNEGPIILGSKPCLEMRLETLKRTQRSLRNHILRINLNKENHYNLNDGKGLNKHAKRMPLKELEKLDENLSFRINEIQAKLDGEYADTELTQQNKTHESHNGRP